MLIIGELINTSRKVIREAVEKKDAQYIREIAKKQEEAGATYIDVNCGNLINTEVSTMEWLVDVVLEETKLPLCIDSPNHLAVEAGLKKALKNGKPMINSITDEKERWDAILPLIMEYDTKIIALCCDDGGMPKSLDDRLRIADSMITKLTAKGTSIEDIYIDPLVKPISAGEKHGIEVLDAIQKIMENYPGVHTVCGLTNISYSLPVRKVINTTFMIQTMARGMDSYILDPTSKDMRGALIVSKALLGKDRFCKEFLAGYRNGLYE